MTNATAITALIENIFTDEFNHEKDALLYNLIGVITDHYEIPDLLELMAELTTTEDVYEASEAFVNDTLTKIKNETIACEPIAKRIREDGRLDIMRGCDL